MDNVLEPLKLTRKDGKVVGVTFFDNSDVSGVEILDIKNLSLRVQKQKTSKNSKFITKF